MRSFDSALVAALTGKTASPYLCVKIIRTDGQVIRFAQVQEPVTIDGEIFAPAAAISIASIPFELSGTSTRVDFYVAAVDPANSANRTIPPTLDAGAIRDGLFANAAVVIYLQDRSTSPSLENVLYVGAMGAMTISERGYAEIECVGLLDRANQIVPELYCPVCRADFGDRRCKVPLAPLTQRVTALTYDGGYHLAVAGLSDAALKAAASRGTITFTLNPAIYDWISINGVKIYFWPVPNPAGTVPILESPSQTLWALLLFLDQSLNPKLTVMDYAVGGAGILQITAKTPGDVGNYPIAANVAAVSGPKLVSGSICAAGRFDFSGQPAHDSQIAIQGTVLTFYAAVDPPFGYVGIGADLSETLGYLMSFLLDSTDANLGLMNYAIDAEGLIVQAKVAGTPGNAYSLWASAASHAVVSGATLEGGGGQALSDYFLNGQLIFRSGAMQGQAYEIQGSLGNVLSLFTPLELRPAIGDLIDVIQGCDHSPFAQGCGKFSNIANYRGEPWAPGDAVEQDLTFVAPVTSGGAIVTTGIGSDDGEYPEYFEVTDT
jgi:hypothetical protein